MWKDSCDKVCTVKRQHRLYLWRHVYGNLRDARPDKNLRLRGHPGPGPGRRDPLCGEGVLFGGGGHIRVREVHAAAHAGGPGPAHLRAGGGGRQGPLQPQGRGPDHLPAEEDRLRVPELQPGAGAERVREHRPAPPAGRQEAGPGLPPPDHRDPGPGAEAAQPPQQPLRRTAAAGGHCPGPGGKARHPPGRRAHGQPGLPHQSGRDEPAEGHGGALRPDHRHDYPQRGDCPDGGPDRAH